MKNKVVKIKKEYYKAMKLMKHTNIKSASLGKRGL